MRRIVYVCFVLAAVAATLVALGCGGGSSSSSNSMASISTSASDPATCGAPQGPFSHVFVTITDVEIHQSADAGPNDAGWVDLTPSLKNNPKQVDLLAAANNQCFLATLGSDTEIQPGTYQQIRVPRRQWHHGRREPMRSGCQLRDADQRSQQHALRPATFV